MAGSHTPASARDTSLDSSPLTLVSTLEHGLSARLAGRVDGHLAAFAEHMREDCWPPRPPSAWKSWPS